MIAKFTVGSIDRVTGTMHFSSLDLTSMIDNPRWIGEQTILKHNTRIMFFGYSLP